MRQSTKAEIIIGVFALAFIYLIITNNVSITGFAIGTYSDVTLVSPTNNVYTKQTDTTFMFKYTLDFEATECTLIVNEINVKSTNSLLSPHDTRIRKYLEPGIYYWRIECADEQGNKASSSTRRLVIESEEQPDLRVTQFYNREGYLYEFDLKPDLELSIDKVLQNDVIRVFIGKKSYDINIVRITQDYKRGVEFVEILVIPGNKWIKIEEGAILSLDLDSDGYYDLDVVLNEISYRKAYFTVRTNTDSGLIIGAAIRSDRGEAETAELAKLLFIGAFIILIIASFSRSKTKKEEETEYISGLRKKVALIKAKIKKRKDKKKKKDKKKSKKKIKKKKRAKKAAKKQATRRVAVPAKRSSLKKAKRKK